jgi:hypothetical protein
MKRLERRLGSWQPGAIPMFCLHTDHCTDLRVQRPLIGYERTQVVLSDGTE